jgi:hypothetical protein
MNVLRRAPTRMPNAGSLRPRRDLSLGLGSLLTVTSAKRMRGIPD